MASRKQATPGITTVMTTELNALASAGAATSSSDYDNSANLYLGGYLELNVTFGSAPTAGTTVDVYALPALDGTNHTTVNGSNVNAPMPMLLASLPVEAVTSAQRIVAPMAFMPPCKFEFFLKNGTNQAFPGTSSTLKLLPTYETIA